MTAISGKRLLPSCNQIFLAWIFTCFFVGQFFRSDIIASLMDRRLDVIDSLEELLNSNMIPIISDTGFVYTQVLNVRLTSIKVENILQNSQLQDYPNLKSRAEAMKGNDIASVSTFRKIFSETHVVIGDEDWLKLIRDYYSGLRLHVSRNSRRPSSGVFMTRKNLD